MSDTTTLTLTDFLLARIAEDEEVARAATLGPWDHDEDEVWHPSPVLGVSLAVVEGTIGESDAAHVARHDPARVLAECEAKRRIVEEAWKTEVAIESEYGQSRSRRELSARGINPVVIELLALPYADHPDYREEWRV